jgi:signal transduction histidine kinase
VNLVMNAIEAIPDKGRIAVETCTEEDWAVLVVADTGRGMSADYVRDHLFRPFQTTKPRGLGIGLCQCRHIAQVHGGTLTVDSHEGQGTRMTVRLPAVSSPCPPQVLLCSHSAEGSLSARMYTRGGATR